MAATMYTHPPYIQEDFNIPLPDCMYRMESIQKLSNLDEEKPPSPEISGILKRQEKILTDLDCLRHQIEALEKKVGVNEKDLKEEVKARNLDHLTSFPAVTEDLDLVITASLSNPPISALMLFDYLRKNGLKVTAACHAHSSLKGVLPENIVRYFDTKHLLVQPHQQLNFSFIWKEDPFGPSLIVNPRIQTPIKGDANIARFLCRKFAPHLYENLDENLVSMADSFMDIAFTKITNGNKDETKKALKQLEKQTAGKSWLVSSNISIADIVIWSALLGSKKIGLLQENLKTWAHNMKETFPKASSAFS